MPTLRRFAALVQEGHKGCAVEVPFHASEVFGIEPSELVYGKVRGIPIRGALAPDVPRATAVAFESWIVFRWGKHFLLLDDELLADAGVKAGTRARVQVEARDRPARRKP